MKNAKLLKPLALVFIVGAAVIAFGLAGQQALSEGVDGAGNKACGASSDACCSKAKAAAAAQCERGQTCGEAKAASVEKSADLSTKQGRSEAVWAEYKAAQNANCEAAKAEGAACSLKAAADKATCPLAAAKAAAVACEGKQACCAELAGSCAGPACEKAAACEAQKGACPSQQAKAEVAVPSE
ncbi:MAG TPA: hypothetical protein PLD73_00690 [Candidatus Hydrogenedentes bacterium]|jgi:hypothetical protein|nr:hypothetical protein [Candidatus Hydrogenedentota bacterium]HPK00561.1 hypothetical protein [Candidatus Hydrogenedentota bacterium]